MLNKIYPENRNDKQQFLLVILCKNVVWRINLHASVISVQEKIEHHPIVIWRRLKGRQMTYSICSLTTFQNIHFSYVIRKPKLIYVYFI
jgi:hypothetical protein